MIEILAPCGSPEHIKAAVYAGADAVYLGGHKFSARRNAVNFSRAELEAVIRFCREFGVKVYVTVNILTRDNEMPEMEKYICELAEAAPDALIVQDMGVASLCKRVVPGLPLHASTQLSVHTLEGVRFCAEAGFTRVVAARECSRVELEEITRHSPIEVETFVHGALCVSVSGQCEMSAVIGRRSGNRGLCAQPCRLAYAAPACETPGLSGASSKYRPRKVISPFPLSLKDLTLINEIPILQKMGVAAVKIEGRMKRPEYVAAAVTACRAVLSGGKPDMEGLRAVFSREGFTQGYFTGDFSDMNGTRVAEDAGKSSDALAKYAELTRTPQRLTPVRMKFFAREGKPTVLTVTAAEDAGIHVPVAETHMSSPKTRGFLGREISRLSTTVHGDVPESAIKRETAADEIRARLGRLGGTPFMVEEIEVHAGEGLFIPVSKINAMRQEACALLIAERVKKNTPVIGEADGIVCGTQASNAQAVSQQALAAQGKKQSVIVAQHILYSISTQVKPFKPALRVHCENSAQAEAALSYKETQAAVNFQTALSLIKKGYDSDKIIISPGRFITNEKNLSAELNKLRAEGFSHVLCQNPAHIFLGKEAGFKFLHGGAGLNVFNSEAANFFREAGLTDVTASTELAVKESLPMAKHFSVGLTVYGRLPLMLLRRCPFGRRVKQAAQGRAVNCGNCENCPGALTDRTKRSFPVVCRGGYQELLNADVLWMADKLNELKAFAFHSLLINEETQEETRSVIDAYMNGGEPPENFTRGLLYRGVE